MPWNDLNTQQKMEFARRNIQHWAQVHDALAAGQNITINVDDSDTAAAIREKVVAEKQRLSGLIQRPPSLADFEAELAAEAAAQ